MTINWLSLKPLDPRHYDRTPPFYRNSVEVDDEDAEFVQHQLQYQDVDIAVKQKSLGGTSVGG